MVDRSFVLAALGVALAAAAGLVVFMWPAVTTRFALLPGELGDTRFVNAVLEHWWQTIRFGGDWRSPPMFHPTPGTLAKSEALFLLVPFYAAARLAQLAPYHAMVVTVMTLLLVGYASTVWLLRRVIGLPLWIAVAGGLLYAFPAIRAIHYGHPQLFAAMFVPLLFGLAMIYGRRLRAGGLGLGVGLPLAVGLPLLFLTSFYVAWFFGFSLLLFGVALAAQGVRQRAGALWSARGLRRGMVSLMLLACAFLLASVPLLSLYLPHYASAGLRPWSQVVQTLPTPIDFLNVGPSNYLWGWAVQRFVPDGRPLQWELSYGLPPILLLVFLGTAAALLVRDIRRTAGQFASPDEGVMRAMAIAVVTAWVLMVVIDGATLWHMVYGGVPGASVLRAVFRFQSVLLLGVLCVAAFGLAWLWRIAAKSHFMRAAVVGCVSLLFAEQFDPGMPVFDARAEIRREAAIQPPPTHCKSFLLLADSRVQRPQYAWQLDAVFLALRFRVPTVNGYSGDVPRGWDMQDPAAADYVARAADWVATHAGEEGLCTFNAAEGTWRRVLPRAGELRGRNLIDLRPTTLDAALGVRLSGFHGLEPSGRWTSGLGRIVLTPAPVAGKLRIDGANWSPTRGPVRIVVNDEVVHDAPLAQGPFSLTMPLNQEPVKQIEIDSDTFVPQLLGINADPRQLGVVVSRLVLESIRPCF